MKEVLFLCTGNSARSIMGEFILNDLANGQFQAFSAGSKPVGTVNPYSIKTLQKNGISCENSSSKSWDIFQGKYFDIVVTVCNNAANEMCPNFKGKYKKLHWDLDDPAAVLEEQKDEQFQLTFQILKQRIQSEILNV